MKLLRNVWKWVITTSFMCPVKKFLFEYGGFFWCWQPDPEKGKLDEDQEAERLSKVKASMTKEDLAELTRATEDLRLKQETPDSPEALKVVPSLALSDIPKKSTNIPIAVSVEVLLHTFVVHLFNYRKLLAI